jgi:hypothetical protein
MEREARAAEKSASQECKLAELFFVVHDDIVLCWI